MVNRNLDQEKWLHHAGQVAQFIDRHGRLPATKDGPTGAWLSSQRSMLHRGLSPMTSDRAEVLDRLAPGWRIPLPYPNWTWAERAGHLWAFRIQLGRLPSQTADDPEEQKLARWLTMQRTRANRGELAEEQIEWLNIQVPDWHRPTREQSWIQNADALASFRRDHGRWPSETAEEAGERKLATWRRNRREALKSGSGWTEERKAYLKRVAPGWNGS